MNYSYITINGERISLKFGMASFRYLSDKFVDGISFDGQSINEIGVSHLIYSGYHNWCLVKIEKPKYTFEDIVDFVEANLSNGEFLNEVTDVVKVWSENQYLKTSESNSVDDAKKKKSRGMK